MFFRIVYRYIGTARIPAKHKLHILPERTRNLDIYMYICMHIYNLRKKKIYIYVKRKFLVILLYLL